MPELRPSEYVQRGAVVLAGVLKSFAESQPLSGRSWSETYERRDVTNGVTGRIYSHDDPRFLLRVLTEHRAAFGSLVSRAQSNYAHELRETLNRVAHEPHNLTPDDAERALATMRLLIKPWHAVEADAELAALLTLLRDTAAAPAGDPPEGEDTTEAVQECSAASADAAGVTVDAAVDALGEIADAEASAASAPPAPGQFVPAQDDPVAPGDPADDEDLESGLRRVSLTHGRVRVSVIVREAVSLALVENQVSPIVDLTVDNAGEQAAVVTDITVALGGADGDYAEPRLFPDVRLPGMGREDVAATHLRWQLRREAFAQLEEARSAVVEVSAVIDGTMRRGTVPIRLLARDEWSDRSIPELLAAFVTPNASGVAELLDQTAQLLAATTGDPSLQGYQDGRERAVEIGRAAYEAIRARQIRYVTPPASFEDGGQKVRGVAQVLQERFGTCLDLVLLYCSLIEQAGLNPVVVHVPGHAFAGFLTEENQLADVALDDRALIHNLVNSQLFVGVEMTLAADGRSRGFDEAVAATARWRTEDVDGDHSRTIDHLLDIRAAHRRIRPLARMNASGDVIEIEVDAAPAAPYRIRRPAAGATLPPEPARPRRVENWRSALLDLSLRNPLLKLKSTSGVVVATTEASLPVLEDLIADGTSVWLRAGDAIDAIHLAQGRRTARQLDDATLEGILRSEGAVYLDTTSAKHEGTLDRLRRRRKTVLEETGASSLFLTLGALSWKDAKGATALAPLFLLPVTVDGRKGRRYSVQAEPGGQVQPNYCLLEKLRRDFGVEIPVLANPPVDDSGIDLRAVFERVREELLTHSLSFSVEPHCRIALLQFSTLEMWRDLSENWSAFLSNPVVKHLVETPTAEFEDAVGEPKVVPEDEVRARLPLPVDGSQLKAVRWATSGRTFVLQGPPGTGKSQTIANVIADCLAEGRRVLFVAEKQAALDVVRTRLDKVGLGPLCLDVHGRDQSIKAVRAQLDASLSTQPTTWPASYEVTRQRVEGAIEALDSYARRVHEAGAAGVSVWSARQQVLAQAPTAGETEIPFHVPGSVVTGRLPLDEVYAGMRRLSEALRQLGATDDVADWSLVGATGVDDPAVLAPIFERLARALDRLDPSLVALLAVLPTEAQEDLGPWLAHVDDGSVVAPTVVRALGGRRALDDIGALDRDLEHFHSRFGPTLAILTPQSEDIDTAKVRADIAAADGHGFFGRKKAKAAVLDGVLARLAPGADTTYEGLPDLLDVLDRLREADHDLRQRLARFLPGAPTPGQSDLRARLNTLSARLTETAAFMERSPEAESAMDALVASVSRHTTAADLAEFEQAWTAARTAFGATPAGLRSWTAGRPLIDAVRASLPVWQQHVEQGRVARIQRIRRVATELGRLESAGFTDLARKLREGEIPPEGLEARVRRRVTAVVLEERLEASGLDTHDVARHEERIASYRAGVREIRRQLVDVLPSTMLRRRQNAISSMGGLKREVDRKRGGTIRELFQAHGRDVLTVTPCLLMSPHSVAKNLPLGSVDIDVVIFDEASQIRVAEAIGAMGRATSVIVVGDSRQMPPTSMFATSLDAEDDVDPGEEGALDALAPADQESILSEAVDSNLPSLWLTWHYRSQAEELIAFSNAQYYQGKLSSFPAPPGNRPGLGVRLRRVEGHYDRGASRTNQVEADAIMTDIVARLHADPSASIGVVTFNVQQRTLIEDLLEASTDPVIRAALMREEDALFVKNLENVQGDERDTILFSLAFSPDPETGRLRLNFGPLTAAGGERRLNVAITRARREIVLFSSFDPRAIDLTRTGSEGMRHLREYLLFAESADKELHGSAVVDHDLQRADVAARMRAAGLEVGENLGLSTFRVDLGVRMPGREWVAVLLDGPRWADRPTVADRDDIPDTMLTGHMGWAATTTVWTPAWIADADAVVRSVLDIASSAPTVDEPARLAPEPDLPAPNPPVTPPEQPGEAGVSRGGSLGADRGREGETLTSVHASTQVDDAPSITQVDDAPSISDAVRGDALESRPSADVGRAPAEDDGGSEETPSGQSRDEVAEHRATESAPQARSPYATTPDIAPPDPRPREAPRVARRQSVPAAEPTGTTSPAPGSRGVPAHRSAVPFEAADATTRHSTDILDELERTENKVILREELLDILDTEAPIQVDRFMRIAGGRFGLNRTHKVRAEQILRFLPSGYELRGEGDDLFCWPSNVRSEDYPFARTSGHGVRVIEEIPPEEIENAVRIALKGFTLREEQRVLRDVMSSFGFTRMGGVIRAALTGAVLRLEARGVLRRQGDMIGLVKSGR